MPNFLPGQYVTPDEAFPKQTGIGEAASAGFNMALEVNTARVAYEVLGTEFADSPDQSRVLSREELAARISRDSLGASFGRLPTEAQYNFKLENQRKREEYEKILANTTTLGAIAGFAGGVAGSIPDPINLINLIVPGAGLAARATTKVLGAGALSTYKGAAMKAGIENVIAGAAVSPLYALASEAKGYDYTFSDLAVDLTAAGILGSSIGAGSKFIGDRALERELFGDSNIDLDAFYNAPKPIESLDFKASYEVRAEMADTAAFQLVNFGTVDVNGIAARERSRILSSYNFTNLKFNFDGTNYLDAPAVARLASNASLEQRVNGFAVVPMLRDGEVLSAATRDEARELAKQLDRAGDTLRRNVAVVERGGRFELFETVDVNLVRDADGAPRVFKTAEEAANAAGGRQNVVRLVNQDVKNKRGDLKKVNNYLAFKNTSPELLKKLQEDPGLYNYFLPRATPATAQQSSLNGLAGFGDFNPTYTPTPRPRNIFDYREFPAEPVKDTPEAAREAAADLDTALDVVREEYAAMRRQVGDDMLEDTTAFTEAKATAERTGGRVQEYVDCLLRS
jgi:hypothetical protein